MHKNRFHLQRPCCCSSSDGTGVCRCFFRVPMTTSERVQAVRLHRPSLLVLQPTHLLSGLGVGVGLLKLFNYPPSSVCVRRIAAAVVDSAAVVAKNTPCQKHAPVGIETLTGAGWRALHVPGLENRPGSAPAGEPPTFLSCPLPTSSFFLSQSPPLSTHPSAAYCSSVIIKRLTRRCFC